MEVLELLAAVDALVEAALERAERVRSGREVGWESSVHPTLSLLLCLHSPHLRLTTMALAISSSSSSRTGVGALECSGAAGTRGGEVSSP